MKSLVSTVRAAAKSKVLRLATGGLFASLLSAYAWAYPTWDEPTDTGSQADCPYYISHSDASCLHGWWDNTPPASTGVAGGSTWGLQSQCSDWGSVYGRVRIPNDKYGYRLTSSSKKRGYALYRNVSSIKCCPTKGELCHKSQVKKLSGKIKVWNDSTNRYDRVEVRTHGQRYAYCAANPDTIYCEHNLDGDAFTTPVCSNEQGSCTVDDCTSGWNDSDASDDCTTPTFRVGFGDVGDGNKPWCNIETSITCTKPSGSTISGYTNFKFYVSDMADLQFCGSDVIGESRLTTDEDC